MGLQVERLVEMSITGQLKAVIALYKLTLTNTLQPFYKIFLWRNANNNKSQESIWKLQCVTTWDRPTKA